MTRPPVSQRDDFAAVYAAHHREAFRLAYLLCGDRHRAEDITADAFVNLYRRLGRGGVERPGAYLRRIVVNEVSSGFRRLALQRREAAKRHGDQRGTLGPEDMVADQVLIAEALALLPLRQRTAVVLRYFADLPERDVAEAMGCSIGTVKSSVSRGLDRLRTVLGAQEA